MEHQDLSQLTYLSREALSRGGRVFLYLIDDGVSAVGSDVVQGLRQEGVLVFCCAFGARKRGIPWDDKATFGGLTILADMLENCDSFVAFTSVRISTTNSKTRKNARHTLISISMDPVLSHLPAEAVRIAAGLQPWMDTPVDVLLEGPATKIFSADATDLVDGKHFTDHLLAILGWDHPIYIAPNALAIKGAERWGKHLKLLKPRGLKELNSQARHVLSF
jgi:hypothetical protein